jgi:nucleoside-triphosphatase THEP1
VGRARGARRAYELLLRALAEASRLAEQAAALEAASARSDLHVVALVGARGSGKTSAVQRLSALLRERGVAVGGICQPAHDGRRGYDLLDLASGARRPFARRRGQPQRPDAEVDAAGGAALGFRFDPEGWGWAAQRLTQAWSSAEVLLVDELGKLEAAGGGHLAALASPFGRLAAVAPAHHPLVLVLAVQRSVLADVERRFGGLDLVLDLPASGAEIDALGAAIGEMR